jgi:hypothetical protein
MHEGHEGLGVLCVLRVLCVQTFACGRDAEDLREVVEIQAGGVALVRLPCGWRSRRRRSSVFLRTCSAALVAELRNRRGRGRSFVRDLAHIGVPFPAKGITPFCKVDNCTHFRLEQNMNIWL